MGNRHEDLRVSGRVGLGVNDGVTQRGSVVVGKGVGVGVRVGVGVYVGVKVGMEVGVGV